MGRKRSNHNPTDTSGEVPAAASHDFGWLIEHGQAQQIEATRDEQRDL